MLSAHRCYRKAGPGFSQGAAGVNGAGSASRNLGGGGNGICRPDVAWIPYHSNILRMSRKASKINDFTNRKSAYYTTITPFGKEF